MFESLEIPKLLIWILLSTREESKVFISSSSKLVSLTCSFRSAKLDVMVFVTLVFFMGFKKCFFFLWISLRNLFFRGVVNGWIPDSHWRRVSEEELSSFSTSPVSERTTGLLFLLRSCALGTRIENVLDYVVRVLLKMFRFVTLCVFYWKNINITLFYHIFYQKLLSEKFEAKSVSAWQSLILTEAASFCR